MVPWLVYFFSKSPHVYYTTSLLSPFHQSRLEFLQLDGYSKCYNYYATRISVQTIPINEGLLIRPKLPKNLFIQGQCKI